MLEWCILSLVFTFLFVLFFFSIVWFTITLFSISFYAGLIFHSEIFAQLQNWYIITWFSKSKITGATWRYFSWKGEVYNIITYTEFTTASCPHHSGFNCSRDTSNYSCFAQIRCFTKEAGMLVLMTTDGIKCCWHEQLVILGDRRAVSGGRKNSKRARKNSPVLNFSRPY